MQLASHQYARKFKRVRSAKTSKTSVNRRGVRPALTRPKYAGAHAPKGILLAGGSGAGKTLLAQVVGSTPAAGFRSRLRLAGPQILDLRAKASYPLWRKCKGLPSIVVSPAIAEGVVPDALRHSSPA